MAYHYFMTKVINKGLGVTARLDGKSAQVSRRRWTAAGIVMGLFALTGCASSPATPEESNATEVASPGSTNYPVTFDNCGYEVTIDAPPERVVLMSGGTIAEVATMIELGIEDRIVLNSQGLGRTEVPEIEALIDALPGRNKGGRFNREEVFAAEPDLVLSSYYNGFDPDAGAASRDQLEEAGIAHLMSAGSCFTRPDATEEEKAEVATQSVETSFEIIEMIGIIFDVQVEAAALIQDRRDKLAAIEAAVAGREPASVMISYSDDPTHAVLGFVAAGGAFNDLIVRAGGKSAFLDAVPEGDAYAQVTPEIAAVTPIDALVVGMYNDATPADEFAAGMFELFPEWPAAQTDTYTVFYDGIAPGPYNHVAIERLARLLHPDAF